MATSNSPLPPNDSPKAASSFAAFAETYHSSILTILTQGSFYLAFGGYLFLMAALVGFWGVFANLRGAGGETIYFSFSAWLSAYSRPLLLLISSLIASMIGFSLLQASGRATRVIIPADDRTMLTDMLQNNNEAGILNYIRLSSLTGISGSFTKLGLYGLPLATIGLTLIFAGLSLTKSARSENMFDLYKLTLGAFLGSFVQRQVGEAAARNAVVSPPTTVTSQPPTAPQNGQPQKATDLDVAP